MPNTSRYDLTFEDLAELLRDEPRFRVRQLWDAINVRCLAPAEVTDLPKSLRERLSRESALAPALHLATESAADNGSTVKWLWTLSDGRQIETVLMHYSSRSTVCISSQAGCAMGCTFCATGQGGFDRNLSSGEIVEQVAVARRVSHEHPDGPRRLSNVVFMGMGEPLANYERTWKAVTKLHDDFGISARNITVSTVGVAPGIRRMATESLPVNLAVSLHAATDEKRNGLIPLNHRYPLNDLMDACRAYLSAKNRRISIEWALIDGVNDSLQDARELSGLALPIRAHVNLIPLNRTPGYAVQGSSRQRIIAFRDSLVSLGVNATVRRTRGAAIDAACGQLKANADQSPS